MKLYYKPGACSLAAHIVLHELGTDFSIERVDTDTKRTETGADFRAINPKGYVPAIRLPQGDVLTEGAAVLQFLADTRPETGLAPQWGTLERARLIEALNYLASELHKAFGPFFAPTPLGQAERSGAEARLSTRLDHIEAQFADGRAYLLGERFGVADAYLFAVGRWVEAVGLGYARWPRLAAFLAHVAERPAARAALLAEGLTN
ncbi:glutathione transferase GstA [Devosia lacusdianchii]|uniref:glutathione transferase GstA n=1 Tax=Devosia lacusdianchii TaxID=2917991 RepID=UPI001F05B307|nr:glutathione transferase GstA [Devosia sp. JXJ CY 41]